MIEAGLQLMLLGMSVVFVFLIILVALMTVMSAITRRFESPQATSGAGETTSPLPQPASSPQHNNPQIAAILAAVAQHHRRHGRGATQTDNTPSGDHR